MKRLTIILLAALMPFAAMAQKTYSYDTVPGDPMHTRIYTLDNGLRVYLSVNKEKPRVQTYIPVRTGSRNDPAETTGLAHYLEHLMFKGTTHFGTSNPEAERPLLDSIENRFEHYRTITDPVQRKRWYHAIDSLSQLAAQYNIPNEYDKMMSAIGSEGSNAYTSNDVTCYVENIPSNEIEAWAKVQGDRFQNMVIRGFHTELESVYEEYNIGLAHDGNKLYNALMAKLFPTHPYGTQTTIGRGEHLKNPSITNIKAYFRKYYVPNNVAVCMAGDLDPDKTIRIIDKYFGSWQPSPSIDVPQYAPQPTLTAPVDTTVVGQETAFVVLGWKAPAGNSLACDTLDVISEVLSNGRAGLFDLDVNQQMLAHGIGAGLSEMNDYSMFVTQGVPKEGQSLQEVRQLIIDEIGKLKRGEFSDDLLPSVVNNMKRDFYSSLDDNDYRADLFVNAFINHVPWQQTVSRLDRISHMTKAQIVSFANRFFTNGYVCVYKEQGNDTTIKKVEKPEITPIPTNNNLHSTFLDEVVSAEPEPIQPVFLDYDKDLTKAATKKGAPVLYKQNTQDDLFTLCFVFPFGNESDPLYAYAAEYLDYLGTKRLTNAQVKQQFYKLACDYSIGEGEDVSYITLSGLNENLPQALALLEDILHNAVPGQDTYDQYLSLVNKSRQDRKKNQGANFSALREYGMYGPYNAQTGQPSIDTLRAIAPADLLAKLADMENYRHTILYYGPDDLSTLNKLLAKYHPTGKDGGKAAPAARLHVAETTSRNEVYLAPYDAKNLYMVQFHNENKEWTPDQAPIISLFNEYFGGGMNAIVFQEMREARGLAYSASARYSQPERKADKEYFQTYIVTQNDKLADCISEFNLLIDSMPQREASVELAKQSLLKSLATGRITKFSILTSYLAAQKLGLNYDLRRKVYEAVPSLTLQDLVRFANDNIARKPFRYIILGDENNLDIQALEKIGPIRRLTTEEIFGY